MRGLIRWWYSRPGRMGPQYRRSRDWRKTWGTTVRLYFGGDVVQEIIMSVMSCRWVITGANGPKVYLINQ